MRDDVIVRFTSAIGKVPLKCFFLGVSILVFKGSVTYQVIVQEGGAYQSCYLWKWSSLILNKYSPVKFRVQALFLD